MARRFIDRFKPQRQQLSSAGIERPRRGARSSLFTLAKPERDRVPFLSLFALLFVLVLVARLFSLQVVQAPYYQALAEGQRALIRELNPSRGSVFVRDVNTGEEFPLATNQELMFVYAVPRDIKDIDATVERLGSVLDLDDEAQAELAGRLGDQDDLYEPVKRKVGQETWERVVALELPGINASPEDWRIYPEQDLASQVVGYVGFTEDRQSGQYGIEGYFDKELSGHVGLQTSELDSSGRRIAAADNYLAPATDGTDLVLTIDRTIQHMTQEVLESGVKKYQAEYGDIIVLNPHNGEILAMAAYPDFNPNSYQDVEDLSVFKNSAIFDSYEPGSTFKPLVVAAGVDLGLMDENTEFVDTGCRKVDVFNICNFDKKGPGIITTTGALERSSNVAMSQISQKVGNGDLFDYLVSFGLNALTGIELDSEAESNISDADSWPESQLATIGFGQGIATTPLHLITAMSSFANEGRIMQPHIVRELRYADGTVEAAEQTVVSEPIKPSTALTMTAMLVSAIENGVAEAARVDNYTMAGKTGTAQVANEKGNYDSGEWIASFIGYGPVPGDRQVMILVRLFDPDTSIHGANTAAPMFAELAPQILHYLRIPENRETKNN
ncbi:MAG: penicillin-binding protein 2 [bacterium]|nr:penicillin-binding protein 2 [bacterium]